MAILFAAGAGAGSGAQAAAAVAAISTAIAMISLAVIGAIVAEVATATTTSNNGPLSLHIACDCESGQCGVTSVSLIKSKTADRDVIQHATWRLSCAQFLGGPTRPYYGCIHATDDRYAVITPPLAPAGRSILLRKAHAQSEDKAGDVVTNLRTRRAFLISEAVPGYCFSSSVKHFAFLARSM